MEEALEGENPKKSIQGLKEAIKSLVGMKAHLTPSWMESVFSIMKDLKSTSLAVDLPVKRRNFERVSPGDYRKDKMDDSICKIEAELASLTSYLNQLNLQRRQVLSEYLDLKGNIRVFCRIRPFLANERSNHSRYVINADSSNVFIKIANNKKKEYNFDKVFQTESTQDDVFSEIEPVIKSALDGYNVCIFAYGQTGSGKTYTMEGRPEYPGIVPHGIEALFEQVSESNYCFKITFSMLEIYMGGLRDLLIPQKKKLSVHRTPCLSIQMDSSGGVEIENLVAVEVTSFEEVKRLYKVGSRLRSTASTMSNTSSSRSHCLIRLSLTSSNAPERRRETNKMWMVDLGGSERLLKTQASGRRLEEGKAINLSLSALGDVISALQSRKPHVPYRNSKLTQVLRDSLGSDSRTLMLVHVSPKEEDMCESICSLGFASRARKIHLGSEESIEVKAKKEIAMADLLQKVNQFETERQVVKKEIEHLNNRLRCLARIESPIFQHLEASYSSTENMPSTISEEVHNNKESERTSKSLPRFMKPTICSQQKKGTGHQSLTSKTKKPPMVPRNRKPSSVYAESITFKSKGFTCQSDYGSDCSITTNFINRTYTTDDGGSECSLGTLDYQTKKVIFPEQEISPRSLMISLSHESFNKLEDSQVEHDNQRKNLTIDDWLHQQLNEKTSMTTQLSKQGFSVPSEELTSTSNLNYRSTVDEKEISYCINSIDSETENKEDGINLRNGTSLLPMADDEYQQNENFEQVTQELTNIPEQQKDSGKATEEVGVIGQVYVTKMETLVFKENINSATEENFGSDHYKDDPAEPCMLFMPSRRSLFLQKNLKAPEQKDSEDTLAPMMNSQNEKERGNIGRNLAFSETIQKLCATALLGLGIQSLGFGHDFFDGLLL